MEIYDKNSFNCFEPYNGVQVCCHSISSFLDLCLVEKDYNEFRIKRNRTFSNSSFCKRFLSFNELEILNRFKSLKKQVEWMAGRFLVKSMVQRNLSSETPMTEITIMHHEQGAPFVKEFPGLRISISHSGDYAGVALTAMENMDLGLDIEEIGKKPDAMFMKTAFTENELVLMEMTPREIFRHWTMKEAFLKYIKKGFNENLHNVEIIGENIFHKKIKTNVSIISTTIDENYALCLVTGKEALL